MERVKKGERYWYIASDFFAGNFYVTYGVDFYEDIQDGRFTLGNYFHTKEEAEAMAEKIRKVLKGAEVIEMPSEEEILQKVSEIYPSTYNAYAGMFEEPAEKLGFWDCVEWFKSKLK